MPADVTSGHTADEILAAVEQGHLRASHRLLRDWTQLGLLAPPTRRGLGRGRGIVATRSDDQLNLFIALLKQRDAGASLARMCNGPVWLWLRVGDPPVPLSQARRALTTWAETAANPSWSAAEAGARRAANALAQQQTGRRAKTRFQRVVEQQATSGFNRRELHDATKDLLGGPEPRGPDGAQLSPARYAHLVEARMRGVERLAALTDADFERARELYRSSHAGYAADQPRFAADPDFGHIFEAPSTENELNTACIGLLTVIGVLPDEGASDDQRNA